MNKVLILVACSALICSLARIHARESYEPVDLTKCGDCVQLCEGWGDRADECIRSCCIN